MSSFKPLPGAYLDIVAKATFVFALRALHNGEVAQNKLLVTFFYWKPCHGDQARGMESMLKACKPMAWRPSQRHRAGYWGLAKDVTDNSKH